MKKTPYYQSPVIEILEVQVEKGFSESGNNDGGISIPGWEIV